MTFISVSDWWNTLSSAEQIFWSIALISSVLFVFQFIVSLFFGFDSDVDVDVSTDVDADAGGDFHLDGDFALFSMRSIIAFFTFFGWAGVLALRAGANVYVAVAFAMVSGGAALVLVAYTLYWFSKLTREGNVNVYEAIYKHGEVYLPIPAGRSGQGKVHFELGGSLREMDAITDANEVIATGTRVVITDVLKEDILLVERLKSEEPA